MPPERVLPARLVQIHRSLPSKDSIAAGAPEIPSGPVPRPGEVLVQTEFPGHPLLLSLLTEGYEGFARTALTERAQASWPPFSRLAAVRDSAKTAESALEFLTEARKLVVVPPRGLRLLGPVPAAMSKRAGR